MAVAKLNTSFQDPTPRAPSLEQDSAVLRLRYKSAQSVLKVHCTTVADWGRVVRTLEKLAADVTRRDQACESARSPRKGDRSASH